MSLANRLVSLKKKEEIAKKLMRKHEASGNWHSTKRAAKLLDGRIQKTKDFIERWK